MEIQYTKGYEFASELKGDSVLVSRGKWFVFADAYAYNSQHKKNARPYQREGSGRLTGKMLKEHAQKVVDHAYKQDACRFFEIYEVFKLESGDWLVKMVFGS